jgi:cell division protein FtsN
MIDYRSKQTGGTLLGLIIGLIIGLGIAVAVAITIKNTPLPFVDKMAKSDRAPAGKMSDPNKPLYGNRDAAKEASKQFAKKSEAEPDGAPDQIAAIAEAANNSDAKLPVKLDAKPVQPKPSLEEKPASEKSAEKSDEKYTYFLQAGAFLEKTDADNTKAKLALLGFSANIEEKASNNGTLYRVRIGPFGEKQVINRMRGKLSDNGVDAAVVRVPR